MPLEIGPEWVESDPFRFCWYNLLAFALQSQGHVSIRNIKGCQEKYYFRKVSIF